MSNKKTKSQSFGLIGGLFAALTLVLLLMGIIALIILLCQFILGLLGVQF